jgi:hypothetical protein
LSDALTNARSSGNPRLELESALLRYVLSSEDPTLEAIGARLCALEESRPSPPFAVAVKPSHPVQSAQPVQSKPSAPARGDAITIQRVRAAWQSIRKKVETEKQSLRVQLSRAVPDSIDGNALVVKLPVAFMADTLKDNSALIEGAIADVLGAPLKVLFKVDGAAPRRSGSSPSGAAGLQSEDPDELFSYLNERIK